jgi:hypothetical protein
MWFNPPMQTVTGVTNVADVTDFEQAIVEVVRALAT